MEDKKNVVYTASSKTPEFAILRSETLLCRDLHSTPHKLSKSDGTRFIHDRASRAQEVHRIIRPGVPRDMSRSGGADGAEMQDAGWWSMIVGVCYFCAS